jgi:hypothetical protein
MDLLCMLLTRSEFSSQAPVSESLASAALSQSETQLQHEIHKPKVYTDGTVRYGLLASSNEPSDYRTTLSDSRWKSAMDVEYDALMKNKIW